MKKQILIIMVVAVLAIGSVGIYSLVNNNENKSTNTSELEKPIDSNKIMNVGEKATDFTLKDIDGNSYTLSDFSGEKVYIKFWASWCPICLTGLDEVDTLAKEADFKVLTIVSPGSNGEQNTENFIEWFNGLETENMIVLLDEDGAIANQYGVRAYPTSSYIGSDGILIKTLPGHASNESIYENIEKIY